MNSQPRSHPTKMVTISATWVSPGNGGMDFVKKGGRVAIADENGCKADFEPILNGWFSQFKQACGFHVARLRGKTAAIVEYTTNRSRGYA